MKCNIDARGIRMRRVGGWICFTLGLAGVALAMAGWFRPWLLYTSLGFCVVGLFSLYEARKGWCAVRAMGVKTRL